MPIIQTEQTKYITPETSVGNDIVDLLNNASHVNINGQWCPILGYDETDDTLCAEGVTEPDWEIPDASSIFCYLDFKISVRVKQLEDES